MGNYLINKIDHGKPNKGGKPKLTEEEYYWIKSYMSSIYGTTKGSIKELKNKINERIWKKTEVKNKWK